MYITFNRHSDDAVTMSSYFDANLQVFTFPSHPLAVRILLTFLRYYIYNGSCVYIWWNTEIIFIRSE